MGEIENTNVTIIGVNVSKGSIADFIRCTKGEEYIPFYKKDSEGDGVWGRFWGTMLRDNTGTPEGYITFEVVPREEWRPYMVSWNKEWIPEYDV